MAGFAGRIFFEGDADTAKALLGDAIKQADKLHAWKTTQRINNVTKVFNLRDGSYCVIADLQNMRAMQIVSPVSSKRIFVIDDAWTPVDHPGVTDVISGVVGSPTIIKEKIPGVAPNGTTIEVEVDALHSFTPTDYSSSRYTSLERRRRLAVQEHFMFTSIGANPAIKYSEHAHVKPSQYSGAMRRVVQLVLGLGVPLQPTWEQRWMKQKKKSYLNRKLKSIASGTMVEARSRFGLYDGAPRSTVLQYDYRFAKTHGISFDQDGVAWVIEISSRGVYAMRLYLDGVSTTVEGKERYIASSPELEDVITEFGGIPLGFPFPASAEFAKWKRAGEVVQLLSSADVAPFYSKSAFSSDIGWAFNQRGSEAHNTCSGISGNFSTGEHYRIRISLQREVMPPLAGSRATLSGYCTELYQVNKCRRMTEAQAKGILDIIKRDAVAGVAAFNNATVEPTLQGSAIMELVRSGLLYNPAFPIAQPQIKFPEPLIGGLVSFDFGPLTHNARALFCDAPMFACFIDDNLEVVNYFYDARPRAGRQSENTREECQFTGSWVNRTYGGEPYIAGNFYSTRWDWRLEITPDEAVTKYTGKKIGVQGMASADAFFSICISVGSSTYFNIKFDTETKQGRGIRLAVAIPFHDRNCYYMAKHAYVSSASRIIGQTTESAAGPQGQQWRLYNFIFHWVGRCGEVANINAGTLGCVAKKFGEYTYESCVADRIPAEIEYSICPGTGFVGQKSVVHAPLWKNGILGSATFPSLPTPSPYSLVTKTAQPEHEYEIRMVNDSGVGDIICEKGEASGEDPQGAGGMVDFYSLDMSSWWFRFSPDPTDGSMPWMGVTQSCLGNVIVNYHTDMDAMTTKHVGTPTNMHAGTSSCYTGVIR